MIENNSIEITPQILNYIAEMDEFKGAWLQLGRLAPERLSALKKIATIESIGSSTRIEGSKLSDPDVEKLLFSGRLESFQNRDEQEVGGYAYTCEKIMEHYGFIPLSENFIKQMHIWLLQYSDKDTRHRGEYKKIPIQIEAFDFNGQSVGILFQTTSPMETPIKMRELVEWTNENLETKKLHPLIVIALFVVLFLAIHPFQDGNGRLSRLLTTLLMIKCGYHYVPYTSLESVIEANKESYYSALQKTQRSWQKGAADWTPWLLFFLQNLQRQKRHLESKIENERKLMKELPGLSNQILELLKQHGGLSIGELATLTQANRNTLKKVLSSLVQNHTISLHGKGKASRYTIFY